MPNFNWCKVLSTWQSNNFFIVTELLLSLKKKVLTRLSTGGNPPSESGSFFTVLASGLLSQSYSISGTNRSRQREQSHFPLKKKVTGLKHLKLSQNCFRDKLMIFYFRGMQTFGNLFSLNINFKLYSLLRVERSSVYYLRTRSNSNSFDSS